MCRRIAAALLLTLAVAPQATAGEPNGDAHAGSAGPAGSRDDEQLLADMGGLRPWLKRFGTIFAANETSEVLGNPVGGRKQRAVYEGLTDLSIKTDLQTYFGAPGTVFARAYQIHGRGLSGGPIGDLAPVSGIEATRTTRLYELWYELPIGDRMQLRVGQQAAGTDFIISMTAQVFINATFGWPNLPALDLPSGGASYPLATPGIRLQAKSDDDLTLLFGVFNGDPAGPGTGDPQLRDASGTAFRINDGAFAIAEARWNPGHSDRNGTYRVGGWVHSEPFADLRYDTNGRSLADPASTGKPRRHTGNYSFYAVVDQPLMRDDEGAVGVFARVMGAAGDRNLVAFYADCGLAVSRPFGRKDDIAAVGIAYSRVGSAARGLASDAARFTGQNFAARPGEAVLELTYQLQLTGWWQVQPDFQYILSPSGGVGQPGLAVRRPRDAAVLGLRTIVTF